MHNPPKPTLEGTTGVAESKARRTCPRKFQPTDSTSGIGTNPGLDRGRRANQTKEHPVPYHSIPQKICVEAPGQNDDVGRHVNRAARRDQLRAGPPSTCKMGRILFRTSLNGNELSRQQAFPPAMVAPTMAMSLNQPVTIDLPTHILEQEPISPPSSRPVPSRRSRRRENMELS